MQGVAFDAAQRIAASATTILRDAITPTRCRPPAARLHRRHRVARAQTLQHELPSLLDRPGVGEAEYALFDSSGNELWSTSPTAAVAEPGRHARAAARRARSRCLDGATGVMLSGLVRKAQPDRAACMHVPIKLPDGIDGSPRRDVSTPSTRSA